MGFAVYEHAHQQGVLGSQPFPTNQPNYYLSLTGKLLVHLDNQQVLFVQFSCLPNIF
jgi:hypothetical protein